MYGVTQAEHIIQGVQILEAEDDDMTFFDGVPQTLIALKEAGYLLGIVTDTSNSVHAKLRWFASGGFGHVWDTIISSKELGTRKPNAPIYEAALKQLGVGACQAVFVGHKISELNGAKAVGLHTVAFNYEAGATADCYVETFADLLTIVDRITS
jgi:HAD superfamily hydrolase (TIGR01509 family)